MQNSLDWPVLRRYTGEQLRRIALPLGGLGTGAVSLGGRGDLRDFEVGNRPAKGFTPSPAFFALWTRDAQGQTMARCLEGPLDAALYEGADGSKAPQHNLPRFRQCAFEATYPLGQVVLSDPDVPVSARLQAFNPFVPGDVTSSSHPVAVLRWILTNPTDQPIDTAICWSLCNFIGSDGTDDAPKANRNQWRSAENIRGLLLSSGGVPQDAPAWGTLAMAALDAPVMPSFRTAWETGDWRDGKGLLDFWDDFAADGRLDERAGAAQDAPIASLCVPLRLAPHAQGTVTFVLAWHFPNRQTWTPQGQFTLPEAALSEPKIGNFYTGQSGDAWDALTRFAPQLPALEAKTLDFARAFYGSDLPAVVKEAAGFNLSTLRSQTLFQTPDGHFFGWEGTYDRTGSCFGSCTHVWNYETATPFLFGAIARSMREIEFAHMTGDNGHMSFRVGLPLEEYARVFPMSAADGQMGCLLKLYREWRGCGDDDWLRKLWPQAKRALQWCWVENGWDGDADGVMEGCQHNTMDVEYYGPNPQMQSWYLGALRACEEMARFVGDAQFADKCRALFDNGSRWTDEHLFNGDYYEHQIRPLEAAPAHGLGGEFPCPDPNWQLGAGCLVDQLAGQYLAHLCGLGHLLDPEHVRQTLQSIARFNARENLWGHFNPLRSFALGDESALLMASYPRGRRPRKPFPYFGEVMTGFEYTAAVGMLQEGLIDEGLTVIQNIRARYNGSKRNPFDEAECGHHYARALASWSAVVALTGFDWDARAQILRFAVSQQPVSWFWSNGTSWGVCRQTPGDSEVEIELRVESQSLTLRRLQLAGYGDFAWPDARIVEAGQSLQLTVKRN